MAAANNVYILHIYCYLLLDGEGCLKAIIFKQTIMTLSTRDSAGLVCPGPGLADISCSIEPVGGLDSSTLPRLIQVAATGAPSHLTPHTPLQVQIIRVASSDTGGEYDVVYSLPREGRYRVWVRVYGRD